MKLSNFLFPARRCRMQSVGEVIREIFNTSREAAQALRYLPLTLAAL